MFFDGGSRDTPSPPAPRRSSRRERTAVIAFVLLGLALLLLPISADGLVDLVRWMGG